MNNKHIVYITDSNYILPTKISIASMLENCKEEHVCIHIIAIDIHEEQMKSLLRIGKIHNNIKIIIHNFSNEFLDLGLNHSYVSKAALYKFKIPEIFSDIDTILYIDGDTLLHSNFLSIFDFDISEYYLAAVQDMIQVVDNKWNKRLQHEKYFNSGVMLLNLKKLREEKISEKLINYKKNDTENSFMDQNALNVILGNDVLWISPSFNFLTAYKERFSKDEIRKFYGLTLKEESLFEKPLILHLSGGEKVWRDVNSEYYFDWIKFVNQEDYSICLKNYINGSRALLQREFEKEKKSLYSQITTISEKLEYYKRRTFYGVLSYIFNSLFKR